jgi:hypothetical protein
MKKNIPNLTTLIEQLQVMNGVEMMTPDDPQYATARLIYNRMHDGYPALIVQTLNSDALRLILAYTFKHDIVLAIREVITLVDLEPVMMVFLLTFHVSKQFK